MKKPYHLTQARLVLEHAENMYPRFLRVFAGALLLPALLITGFRFSKAFRHGDTFGQHITYVLVDTVGANISADKVIASIKTKNWRDTMKWRAK